MSRLTIFLCVLMLVGAVISVDPPSSPKPGDHGQHGPPDMKQPIDIHKQHDTAMQHEPPKMPDPKDKNFQDMQGQGGKS